MINNKIVTDEQQDVLVRKIEVVIKALGTMIVKPQFRATDIIGVKEQIQPIQEGIMQGKDRDTAELKLIELINQL